MLGKKQTKKKQNIKIQLEINGFNGKSHICNIFIYQAFIMKKYDKMWFLLFVSTDLPKGAV